MAINKKLVIIIKIKILLSIISLKTIKIYKET